MEKSKIIKLAESAIDDCQHLKQWVIKNDSRNDDLINLVDEVESLIKKLNTDSRVSGN